MVLVLSAVEAFYLYPSGGGQTGMSALVEPSVNPWGDCLNTVQNTKKRAAHIATLGRLLRKAKDTDEALALHGQMMLEIGFVEQALACYETSLLAMKATGYEAPHAMPVPAQPSPVVAAAIERDRLDSRQLELHQKDGRPLLRDWAKAAANDVEDQDDG